MVLASGRIKGGWETFKARTSFTVGNGRTKFWVDVWCGDAPLKDYFCFFSFFLLIKRFGW